MTRPQFARFVFGAIPCVLASCFNPSLQGVTLQQLSLDQVARVSTEIVRGRVTSSYTALEGRTIFTHYRVQVTDRWKGAPRPAADVAVPGGLLNGIRHTFPGVPELTAGREYVLFLWTGPKGPTQLVGMHQGLFETSEDSDGQLIAGRRASPELMLDEAARPVADQPVRLRLSDLRSRVRAVIGSGVSQ